MNDLRKRMLALSRELREIGRQFARAQRRDSVPSKQLLLDLQQRLDNLRQAVWDTRKLCDPYLVASRRDPPDPPTATLAERILRFVDSRKKTA